MCCNWSSYIWPDAKGYSRSEKNERSKPSASRKPRRKKKKSKLSSLSSKCPVGIHVSIYYKVCFFQLLRAAYNNLAGSNWSAAHEFDLCDLKNIINNSKPSVCQLLLNQHSNFQHFMKFSWKQSGMSEKHVSKRQNSRNKNVNFLPCSCKTISKLYLNLFQLITKSHLYFHQFHIERISLQVVV